MFWCEQCNREVKDEEMIFNYEDNSFKHSVCGCFVESIIGR